MRSAPVVTVKRVVARVACAHVAPMDVRKKILQRINVFPYIPAAPMPLSPIRINNIMHVRRHRLDKCPIFDKIVDLCFAHMRVNVRLDGMIKYLNCPIPADAAPIMLA